MAILIPNLSYSYVFPVNEIAQNTKLLQFLKEKWNVCNQNLEPNDYFYHNKCDSHIIASRQHTCIDSIWHMHFALSATMFILYTNIDIDMVYGQMQNRQSK